MAHRCMLRTRPLCLGALLVVITAKSSQLRPVFAQNLSSGAKDTCTSDSGDLAFTAELNGKLTFKCPSDSTLEPKDATSVSPSIALDGENCESQVSLSNLGLAAKLSEKASQQEERQGGKAKEYEFVVTALPAAEKTLCYVCVIPGAGPGIAPPESSEQHHRNDSPTGTKCRVKISIPADPSSSASTPAPSSSTPAPSAAVPSSNVVSAGAICVFLSLIKPARL